MTWPTLRSGLFKYELRLAILELLEHDPVDPAQGEILDFFDEAEAQRFFLHMMMDYEGDLTIRKFAYGDFRSMTRFCYFDFADGDAFEIAGVLARATIDRELLIVRYEDKLPIVPRKAETKAEPPLVMASPPPATWLGIEVVSDDTGEPIGQLPVTVAGLNDYRNMRETGEDGRIRLTGMQPGACEARCSFSGLMYSDCVAFAGMGPKERAKEASVSASQEQKSSPKAIVLVETKKVKTGETLESIAQGAGLKWQDLAFFNWGTKEPKKINEHLEKDVGCTKKTKDGKNFVFDDSDSPGFLFVPKQWKRSGLATNQVHVVRVSPFSPLQREVKLRVKVMFPVDQTSQFPHKLKLSNDDGSYSKTITLSSSQAGDTEGTAVVTFEGLTRSHTYTLQCDNGDGTPPYNLFENQPYGQIVDRAPDTSQGATHAPPSAPFLDLSADSDSGVGDGDASDVLGFDDGDGSTDPPASMPAGPASAPANQGGT